MICSNSFFRSLLLVSVWCFNKPLFLNAQSGYENYFPLQSEGRIPDDFIKPSYKKYYSDQEDIQKTRDISKKEKKLQNEFAMVTNFKIDDILMSGKVQYGNKVCNYINTVADKVLDSRPELKGKIRFYLLNVSYSNALSTSNGIIFVTTGLMARLKNEAQLAFILSHEISHYTLHHSFEAYKNTKDILASKRYDNLETEDKTQRILRYSKNNESEADIEGLSLYKAAGYNPSEALSVMDLLLYSHLPVADIQFPRNYFNDQYFEIPAVFFGDSAGPIKINENENDEESTHPNTGFRKLKLEKFIKEDTGGHVFYFDREEFDDIVRTCRYELGYLHAIRGDYIRGFYQAYLISQQYGKNAYTAGLMSACVYGLHKDKLYDTDDDDYVLSDAAKEELKSYQGKISELHTFFNFLKTDEFNVLAAKFIYNNALEYPTIYHQKLVVDVFTDLFYAHKYDGETFNKEFESTDNAEVFADEEEDDDDNKSSRKKKKTKSMKRFYSKSTYFKNAFVSEFETEAFESFYNASQRNAEKIKKEEEEMGLEELKSEPRRRYRQWIFDELDAQKRNGKRLGIDSIMIIAPSYSAYYTNSDETEYKNSLLNDELTAINITDCLREMAKNNGLHTEIVDVNGREQMSTEQLNRFGMVSAYLIEKTAHKDKKDVLFSQQYTDSIVSAGGYRYAAITGLTYQSAKHSVNAITVVYSIFTVVPFPFVIAHALDSKKELSFFYIVYDLKTGEEKMLSVVRLRRRPKMKVIKMQYAYVLSQTKMKGKKR